MTIPAFILGIIVSSLYGAAFHLWRGGSPGLLILYLLLSWAGFWIGQFIATRLDFYFVNIGPLHLGIATIGSMFFLAIGYWLSQGDTEK